MGKKRRKNQSFPAMEPDDPTFQIVEKIRALEPDNFFEILGYLLKKDFDKGVLMRLANGSDTQLQSFCHTVKFDLGLTSNRLSMSTPLNSISRPIDDISPLNPISRPIDNIYRPPLPQPSARRLGNRFLGVSSRPNPLLDPSLTSGTLSGNPNFRSNPSLDGSSLFSSSSGVDGINRSGDFADEQQLSNFFPFLNDSSLVNKTDAHLHNRSFSANDPRLESDNLGFGGGYSHRFQQSGLANEFGPPSGFGTPSGMDFISLQQREMMRMKEAQMATSPFMGGSGSSANGARIESDHLGFGGGYSHRFQQSGLANEFGPPSGSGTPSEMDFISLQQRETMRMKEAQMATAPFMGGSGSSANGAHLESDHLGFGGGYKFPQGGLVNEFGPPSGFGTPSQMDLIRRQQEEMMRMKEPQMATAPFTLHENYISSLLQQSHSQRTISRVIYFRTEDCYLSVEEVHKYFSTYGVVDNMRIRYHEDSSVFGYATFVDAETVRNILAKGSHYIRGSHVIVKPYEDEENSFERSQIERDNVSLHSNVTGTQELGTEEAQRRDTEMQLEVERRKLLNLQLPKVEDENSLFIESYAQFPPLDNSVTRKKHLQRVASKDLNKGQETSLACTLPENLLSSPKNSDETHQNESEKGKYSDEDKAV